MTTSRARYQPLSDGSSLTTAATSPPRQSSSQTFRPSGPTRVVSPVAMSIRYSRRQCSAGRVTAGSPPPASIRVAESAPARSEPGSAASTSSRDPSGEKRTSSADPSNVPTGRASPASSSSRWTVARPAWSRSDRNASTRPSGDHRGEVSERGPRVAWRAPEPSARAIQIRLDTPSPGRLNPSAALKATRPPSGENAGCDGWSRSRSRSAITGRSYPPNGVRPLLAGRRLETALVTGVPFPIDAQVEDLHRDRHGRGGERGPRRAGLGALAEQREHHLPGRIDRHRARLRNHRRARRPHVEPWREQRRRELLHERRSERHRRRLARRDDGQPLPVHLEQR